MSETETVGLARDFIAIGTRHANVRVLATDPDVLERAKRDDCPIPPTFQRINYYGDDHFGYWLSGLLDMQQLRDCLAKLGLPVAGPILDFGASSGRVARHWGMEPEGFRVHACEITQRMVTWMQTHLANRVVAKCNAPSPPLPYQDATFGLVYAYSVFSHIYDLEDAWLAELRRVVRPDGVLALTVHNEHTWSLIPSLKFRIRDELSKNADYINLTSSGEAMPARVQFVQSGVSFAFYSNDHIRRKWGQHFDVIDIIDNFHNYQSMVILRPSR